MRLARLLIYPVLLLTAFIGMLPGAVLLGMLALIVPGLILIAAPTVALYAPFLDLLVTGLFTRRPLLWLPGLFGLALIGAALPLGASQALDKRIAAETAGDFERDPGGAPRRLLLYDHRRTAGAAGSLYAGRWLYDSSDGSACDDTCARLLLNRKVEAIIRPSGRDLPPLLDLAGGYAGPASVYTYEPAATCPAGNRLDLDVKADTLAVIGAGHCIIGREVTAPAFDTAVTGLVESAGGAPRLDPMADGLTSVARRAIWRCGPAGCAATAVRTTITARRLAAPLVVGIEDHADMNLRRAFRRSSVTIHPGGRDAWILSLFRMTRAPLPAVDPARQRQSAAATLAAAAAERRPLSAAEAQTIGQVLRIMADRPETPTADDLALLRTIALHPTADFLIYFSQVFYAHPEARAEVADAAVAGFARTASREDPRRQSGLRRSLASVIADLPADSFSARGPAILRAAAIPGALDGAGDLLTRLGDLGPAAVPLLSRALAEPGDAEAAAYGLCRVGAPAVGAAPALVSLQAGGPPWSRDRARVIAVTLARMGRPDLIRRPPPEAYARVNAAGKRYDDAWFDAVPPTITPASPPDVCSQDTVRNRQARRPRPPESR